MADAPTGRGKSGAKRGKSGGREARAGQRAGKKLAFLDKDKFGAPQRKMLARSTPLLPRTKLKPGTVYSGSFKQILRTSWFTVSVSQAILYI